MALIDKRMSPNVFFVCEACGSSVEKYLTRYQKNLGEGRFCNRACAGVWRSGKNHPLWSGGKFRKKEGYILTYRPSHPHCDRNGYVLDHRLVMERHLGRYLTEIEVVHHNNEIGDDNRIENLTLFPNQSEHKKHHDKNRNRDENGRYLPCR